MLNINPSRRISATDALKHPWICVSYLKRRNHSNDLFYFLGYIYIWSIYRFDLLNRREIERERESVDDMEDASGNDYLSARKTKSSE